MNDEEKWERTHQAAKHLLAAVVFYESSNATLQKTEGSLLACIGYYYVGFHAAMAMLWLCPIVVTDSLRLVHHSQLKSLVEKNLVQKRKIDRSFLDEYNKMQEFREYANYYFGDKNPKYEYTQIAPSLGPLTERLLNKALDVLIEELNDLDMLSGFQTKIGDDIGSDLIRLHSGPEVEKKVWTYLIDHHLTT